MMQPKSVPRCLETRPRGGGAGYPMASGKVRLIMRPPEERRFRRWMIICREAGCSL